MDNLREWIRESDGGEFKPTPKQIDSYEQWLDQEGHHLLLPDQPLFPALFSDLRQPPAALWVKGDPDLLNEPQIAMVGSRTATSGGIKNAEAFAENFSASGLIVTSGLAQGIDGAAHRGALRRGSTIAVLGSGLAFIYPRENEELANRISAAGAIVSEYPPDAQPKRYHFPQRNRLIAALTLGTLVVEASLQSGALITARVAADLGRDVFAIPGSIHSPLSRGCHQLIKEGAILLDQASDLLESLGSRLSLYLQNVDCQGALRSPAQADGERDPSYQKLLNALGFEPTTVTELTTSTGLTSAELSSMLLILELEGSVEALPGGRYSRLS